MALSTALLAVSTALKIGGEIADHVAQKEQAEQQRTAARRAFKLKSRDISIRGIEEKRAVRQKRLQARRQARSATGRARASAAAAGVEGASADAIISTVGGDLGRFLQSTESNLTMTLDQLERIRAGASAERDRRINAARDPSLVGTLLRVGAHGVGFLTSINDAPLRAEVPDTEGGEDTEGDDSDVIERRSGGYLG